MNCNCSKANLVLAIVAIVFALWQTTYSKLIVVIAAALIGIHSLMHKHSEGGKTGKVGRRR